MMDEKHNEIMKYVLDEPEQAAREIGRMRKLKAELIADLKASLTRLDVPMPKGLELMALAGEYAERSGYATATIRFALKDLEWTHE